MQKTFIYVIVYIMDFIIWKLFSIHYFGAGFSVFLHWNKMCSISITKLKFENPKKKKKKPEGVIICNNIY